MSKAEELLNTLIASADTDGLTISSQEPHIVVGNDRYITVPEELKRIAVQHDHDIETVTFDCPRYWDEHDMSQMTIYVNYLRSDGENGAYNVRNVTVDSSDESIMHFDWTISRNVTETYGKIIFLVCIKKPDENGNEVNHWNSELCKDCYVSEGLEYAEDSLPEIYPDIIEQWRREVIALMDEVNAAKDQWNQDISDAVNSANAATNQILQDVEDGKFNGATFTPSVSADGDISWTNNKDLANPETVNIRGVPGVSPIIDVTDISGGHRVTITDINGTKSFDVMDTIISATDEVKQMFNDFVSIGTEEPASGPVLWFDTTTT